MSPTVSIVITCYNLGLYLESTIKSVSCQTFKDFEIILVDDGSDDKKTLRVIEQLNYPNLKIIRIANSGVTIARNIGINNSNGKYILILDGDDILIDTFLEKTVKILDSYPTVKLVRTGVRSFGYRNGFYSYPDYSFERLLMQNLMVVSSLFRRVDFDKTNGFSNNMKDGLEDWNFWIDLLKNGGDVYHLDEILFLYRRRKISRNKVRSLEEDLNLRKQIYINHKVEYDKLLTNPTWIFEYQQVINSKEYKLATYLLSFSKLKSFLKSKFNLDNFNSISTK